MRHDLSKLLKALFRPTLANWAKIITVTPPIGEPRKPRPMNKRRKEVKRP